MQNTILKILFKMDRRYHTSDLYSELQLMNVRQLYTYHCLLWMFSNGAGNVDAVHEYDTRFAHHLRAPYCRFSRFQNMVFYYGPKLYNLLAPEIKYIANKSGYKRGITRYILSNFDLINDVF